jgi:hypothetical protein
MIYHPDLTMSDARQLYFERSGFTESTGYEGRWIKVEVWRIPIWIPNTKGRRKAVKLHDLHHVLTEYPTTWRGEAEISAWEIGSGGLQKYWAGWLLDLMNVAQGIVINPRGIYRGFMLGRRTFNLYSTEFNDELLNARVGDLRRKLHLDQPAGSPTARDRAAFLFWLTVSVTVYVVKIILPIELFLLFVLWILFPQLFSNILS